MDYAFKIDNAQTVDLAKYSADVHGKIDKVDAAATVAKLGQELSALQELLYASACNGVLIVLQGMDTSGKDGTIRHVFAFANPQGCEVASFKQPTLVEFAHDFLWRVHLHAPLKGMLNIFNRSHYEDVLVVRVHKLVDEDVIQRRFEQIVQFEELLTSNGTIILKFFFTFPRMSRRNGSLLAKTMPPSRGSFLWPIGMSANTGTTISRRMPMPWARPLANTLPGLSSPPTTNGIEILPSPRPW